LAMKANCSVSLFFLAALLIASSCLSINSRCAVATPTTDSSGAAHADRLQDQARSSSNEVIIPGSLRSFLRMAAISQKVSPEEVLSFLARNVAVKGYRKGKPTEYLILLNRYLEQAKELLALAGPQGVIRVSNCDDAQPLLAILGYRLKQSCGPDAALETSNADRAFLTIDSGFPLAELEETLRGGKPFIDPYLSSSVPVLFAPADWTGNAKNDQSGKKDVLDSLLDNFDLARLYWAMSRMDTETRVFLWQSRGLNRLLPYAAVLDFYGSHISIRAGRVVVPGGRVAESAWKDLVGASPASPAEFVTRLLAKDEGWLAVYFDALSRSSQKQQLYFTPSGRLQRFYEALRGRDIFPSPAKHSFRPDSNLFLLVNQLQWEPDGQPHIPGNLDTWKEILRKKTDSKIVREWGKRANGWNKPEQLVEGMFALSRVSSMDGPLQIFLMLSEIDCERPPRQRLDVPTARLLAERFPEFGDQYLIFSEFPGLNNVSIRRFLAVAEDLDRVPNHLLRADALGLFQANVGLWQILARQGQIPGASLNDSWQKAIGPFASVRSSAQLFDAGQASLTGLLQAAAGKPILSQDEVITLLAGPAQASREGQQVRQQSSRCRGPCSPLGKELPMRLAFTVTATSCCRCGPICPK
jgi:hypothetical protein